MDLLEQVSGCGTQSGGVGTQPGGVVLRLGVLYPDWEYGTQTGSMVPNLGGCGTQPGVPSLGVWYPAWGCELVQD